MASYRIILPLVVALAVLGGCVKTKPEPPAVLDTTTEMGWVEKGKFNPVGPFEEGLRTGYAELGSEYFLDKSRRSIEGRGVRPDHPHTRRLPPESIVGVHDGYDRMIRVLNLGGAKLAPGEAATMQVSFDCWIDSLERFGSAGSFCGDAFWDALGSVEATCQQVLDDRCQIKVAAPPPAPREPQQFIVFFDFDSADLTIDALQILASAAEYVRAGGMSRIEVIGHTDTSGSASYNDALSQRRAEAVRAELVGQGIIRDAIGIDWRGESEPLIETGDGIREPQNRRAEIVIR